MRWILVADASRALLFRANGTNDPYELVETMDHAESRARARDLMADSNGRKPVGGSVASSYGGRSVSLGHGRPGAAPHTEPKEVEAQRFARELSETLERGLLDKQFDSVVIAAPAQFLGLLKGTVSKEVSKHIEATFSKDFTHMDRHAIESHMRQQLGNVSPS